ncbi:UvrD-helicase domain-containing protein [Delftia sp. ZNC0008]|uniref:UvrD-helicase domain-containing protein n=1 Tax=Delftia sp. ZNC0008 TaxID=1339242 RepID=UPI000646E905|nr:UvrD-helicase domain-containing protein [Delftia sp. ZNC0008]
MTAAVDAQEKDLDAGVVEEICGYLTETPPRSFFLFAGAGSGKTYTLIEVLRRLTGVTAHEKGGQVARSLRMYGRSIRVVTYTKNAVAIIKGRLGENDLVGVSTIHAFCWELISGFDDDIREALISLKEAKHAKDTAAGLSKPKGITAAKQRDLDKLLADIEAIRQTETFIYHPDRDTYGPGALVHSDVLGATAWLIERRPTLRTVLKDRYPVVLIDESQDTIEGVLDALLAVAEPRGSGLTLGLIGDHRQRIYLEGHDDLPSHVPASWATPELKMNRRSQRRIVDLINDIWAADLDGRTQPATGVKQHPRKDKNGGIVRIFVGLNDLSDDEKVAGERWCADHMRAATSSASWDDGYQTLALEHKLVAKRGSFVEVFEAMDLLDPNSSSPSGSFEKKGPAAARLMLSELAQLEACLNDDGTLNEFLATEVLRQHKCLDGIPEDALARESRIDEMLVALSDFAKACSTPAASVEQVLQPILTARIFEVDAKLSAAFADKSPAPPPPQKKSDEAKVDRLKRGWSELFAAPWSQLRKYRTYLAGGSELATHQVVKGSEFKNVMVVMDDKMAGGTLFYYDKILGGLALSATDRANAGNGVETTIDRTLRLLYVTCSRAEESLALVLWSHNPAAALSHLRTNGWFAPEEVVEIP